MAPATQTPDEHGQAALEDELHDLESQEEALERRTSTLEAAGPLGLIFSIIAVALAVGAMILAIATKGSNTEKVVTVAAPATAASGAGNGTAASSSKGAGMMGASSTMANMMGYGGHGSFTAAEVAAAKHGTVDVQLGDYWVAPTVASVKAGTVTFNAKNVGQVPHELMIEHSPIKMDAPNQPNEDAAQGMIDDMMAGQSGHMTLHLTPGTYTLFCNAPGHYAMGQHITFKVTGS